MKKIILLIATAFLLAACSGKPDATDSHGNAIHLSQYKGKWVFINYWAEWCKPCIKEMPDLNKLFVEHKNIVVLGVNFDKASNDELNRVAKKWGVTYPLMKQFPLEQYNIKAVSILPVTYVINPQGQWVSTLKGPRTEQQFLQVTKAH